MNEVTHFLTGYLIARLLLDKKEDHFQTFLVAFAALIPDFDSFLHIFIPIEPLEHAVFTHTILGGLLLTLIYTSLIWMIGRKFLRHLDLSFKSLVFLTILGVASHFILDVFTYRQDIATTSAHLYFWPLSDFSWHLNGFFPNVAYLTRILIEVVYTAVISSYVLFFQWAHKKENPFTMLKFNNWLSYVEEEALREESKTSAMAVLVFNFSIIGLMAISLFL